MSNSEISSAVRAAAVLAILALALNVGLFAAGSRRAWTDFALPLLILGNLLANHPRVRDSRLTTRVYFPASIAIAVAILASGVWRIFHPR